MKGAIIFAVFLVLTLTASAHKHPPVAEGDYRDGVLVKYETASAGMSCSSSSSGTVNDDGKIETSGHGGCSEDTVAHYTVAVDGQAYVLSPARTHPKTAILTLGYSDAFQKHSVLYLQPLGTHVAVRLQKEKLFVKLGDRESPYYVVAMTAVPKAETSFLPAPTPAVPEQPPSQPAAPQPAPKKEQSIPAPSPAPQPAPAPAAKQEERPCLASYIDAQGRETCTRRVGDK